MTNSKVTVVLYRPEIPQNTGNIVRTCSVTGCSLVLTTPLGFSTSEKQLRRAGLDYWDEVNIEKISDLEQFLEKTDRPFYFFSSKASKNYIEIPFTERDLLIFGNETSGLDPALLEKYPERFYTIPMKPSARCLNLSNSVSIVLYENLRQRGFPGFQ